MRWLLVLLLIFFHLPKLVFFKKVVFVESELSLTTSSRLVLILSAE